MEFDFTIEKPVETLIQILSVLFTFDELLYANRHAYVTIKKIQMRWQPGETFYLLCRIPVVGLGDLTSGFCRPSPGKSTQEIRGNWSPMSPLTVRNAHVHAVPLHSLTHCQPEKRWKINEKNCTNHGRVKDKRQKTGLLTLMTSLQREPAHGLLQPHLSQAAGFSLMKAAAGCSSQNGTHARS